MGAIEIELQNLRLCVNENDSKLALGVITEEQYEETNKWIESRLRKLEQVIYGC